FAGLVLSVALAVALTLLVDTRPPVVYTLVVGALVPIVALATPRVRLQTDISYGVYLLHGPVIQLALLTGIYRPDWIGLAGVAGRPAWLAARLIRTPGMPRGRRLGQRVGRAATLPLGDRAAGPPQRAKA